MKSTRVVVVTSTRADYGLLRPLLFALQDDPDFELELVVTGTHLSAHHGKTVNEIESDSFDVAARVPILSESDSAISVALASARATSGIANALNSLDPDLVIVLGDRYEILAATQAAFLLRIPVVHLFGGEVTSGSLDDSIRHAITKLSQIHCVSSEEYAARVRQLGEDPENIHIVSTLALDNLLGIEEIPFSDVSEKAKFEFEEGKFILCTFHSATAESEPAAGIYPLLEALDELSDRQVLFTLSNADEGGLHINAAIQDFVQRNSTRSIAVDSLGSKLYLRAVAGASIVLGNSSSGIVEAPSLGTPTVNVGDRQESRLRAPSVIDVPATQEAISKAIRRAETEEFRAICASKTSPFGTPGASQRILQVLSETNLSGITKKVFQDASIDLKGRTSGV